MKKIAYVFLLLLFACFFYVLWNFMQLDQLKQERNQYYEEVLTPLRIKSNQLQLEINRLDNEFRQLENGQASTAVLFHGAYEAVYTDIYPKMKQHSYQGMIALEENMLPGSKGSMSYANFLELLEQGWSYCICSESDVSSINLWLHQHGLEKSNILYSSQKKFPEEHLDYFIEQGFTTFIHHGEAQHSLTKMETQGDLRFVGSVGLQGDQPKYQLQDTIDQRGSILFVVGFVLDSESYDEAMFESMLRYFDDFVESKELIVSDVKGMLFYEENRNRSLEDAKKEYDKRKNELYQQMNEIQQEMEEKIDEIKAQNTDAIK